MMTDKEKIEKLAAMAISLYNRLELLAPMDETEDKTTQDLRREIGAIARGEI